MKLHILGCGDAFGSGGRNSSGYLVEAGDRIFLLDCGPTTLAAMKRAGFDPRRLDAIFLSHLHGDHCAGLPFFFLDYLYEHPRDKPLHVAGPAGTEEKARGLFQLMYGGLSRSKKLPSVLFDVLVPEESKAILGIEVFAFRVPHQVDEVSLGIKIAYQGKQILYSGDSAWTDLFVTYARGADLFLCECSFFDRETTNHINYQTIRQNLSRLECRRLLLTHMGEEMLGRRAEVDVLSAKDGMVLEI